VKRALEKREPKIYENDKTAVFIRGGHTSEIVTQFLAELVLSIDSNCFLWIYYSFTLHYVELFYVFVSPCTALVHLIRPFHLKSKLQSEVIRESW